jgi:HSP20 family protein
MFEIIPFERRNNQVSSYDPFRAFDEMERSFFKNSLTEFRTDVSDNGDSFLVEAELPGFNKEDIHIDIVNDCLTISAERKYDNEDKDDKKNFIRRERYYGSYSRSFDVTGIDTDAIKAEYKDGVLNLTLPKKAPETPAAKKVEIL